MVDGTKTAFLAGEWVVDPEMNSLTREQEERHVEPKVMKVLVTLASQGDHVFSKEELIAAVWPDIFVSDDVLTRCISILRRVTDDDPHSPRFIQTVPKVGYRLVARISTIPSFRPGLSVAAEEVAEPSLVERAERRFPIAGWLVAFALVLGLLGGGIFFALAHRTSRGSAGSFRTVEFTSYDGEQTEPEFSPDGTRIAFVWIASGGTSRRIYVKQIGSESLVRLTDGDDEQFSPAWSPDGRQIAYLSRSSAGLGLFLADAGGGGLPRKVLIPQEPSHWEQGALSWSPDGKSLVFPDHDGSEPNSTIYQLDLQTHNVRSITNPPAGWEGDLNPAFSPDGKAIAFTRASETAVRDVYWLSVADGKVHQVTEDRMNIDSLTWTADSSAIVFSSNRGGKYGLWRTAKTGGQAVRLPVGTEDAFQPSAGPKAGQIAYTRGTAIWGILRIQGAGQPERILSSTQHDSAPSLAPDGRFFAMQSSRSGSQEIWVASIDGGSLRQLTSMGGPLTGSPSWSNQGNRVLFDSRPDGHSHIFEIAAGGGKARQLTFGDANDIVPRWSRDDRTVYFRSNRGGRWQLWKIAEAGGEPQPVTTGDGIEPQESPDGQWLYFTRGGEDGIWRVPTTGGAETQVAQQPVAGYWGYWQVTGAGIFYLDRNASRWSIRLLNPETKQSGPVANLLQAPPLYAGLSTVMEGKTMLMTDQRDAGRHITLVVAQP